MKKKSNLLYYLAALFVFTFAFSANVYAYCPLGPDVTKDLYGVLKIIRIAGPLLVVGLSTVDAVKALTKGDGGVDMKKVAQRFGKRCIYAALLFFLPMLVDQFMQMADVWDANGTCNLEAPEDNGAASSGASGAAGAAAGAVTGGAASAAGAVTGGTTTTTTTTTTTRNVCAQYDSMICDSQSGCYWDGSKNICSMK